MNAHTHANHQCVGFAEANIKLNTIHMFLCVIYMIWGHVAVSCIYLAWAITVIHVRTEVALYFTGSRFQLLHIVTGHVAVYWTIASALSVYWITHKNIKQNEIKLMQQNKTTATTEEGGRNQSTTLTRPNTTTKNIKKYSKLK